MCGIAAIFAYHASAPSVNEGELTAIRDQMTARGPDGCGLWLDDSRRAGLGHRRLSIIDLSDAGAQPMLWPEKNWPSSSTARFTTTANSAPTY